MSKKTLILLKNSGYEKKEKKIKKIVVMIVVIHLKHWSQGDLGRKNMTIGNLGLKIKTLLFCCWSVENQIRSDHRSIWSDLLWSDLIWFDKKDRSIWQIGIRSLQIDLIWQIDLMKSDQIRSDRVIWSDKIRSDQIRSGVFHQ